MVRSMLLPLALATGIAANAGDAKLDRATLKGATAVGVVVDRLPDDLAREGVTADALQLRLAQRLREAHIPADGSAKEFVGIRLASVHEAKELYAVSISIGFYQPVTLV